MKITVLSICALFLFLTSCQKEVSFEEGNGTPGTNTSGTLLTKSVSKSGTDSSVSIYNYDASNRLSSQKVSGTYGGMDFEMTTTIKRNSQGIINELIIESDELAQYGLSNIVTKVNYNTASKRYTSKVTTISFMGFDFTDSTAINYDGSGKVQSEISYMNDGITGYEESVKWEYTYSGNNLASVKLSSYDAMTSTWTVEENLAFEYDSKINPIQFASEAVVLNMTSYYSANNGTKFTMTSPTDPSTDQTTTYTYNYNSKDRPESGTSTTNPGNMVAQNTYYYK